MANILPHIERLAPYPAGAQPEKGPRTIQLNLNENPYPPSPRVKEMFGMMDVNDLRKYPDSRNLQLRAALAEAHGLSIDQSYCGNGSSEIISNVFSACFSSGSSIAVPDPSFPLYYTMASIHQVEYIHVPTREDWSVDLDSLLESGANAVVLINPNAPTGLLNTFSEVERLVSHFPGLVILDEAYMDFADPGHSAVSLVKRYDNLIVLRTFSKAYALCGGRIGYCFSNPALIEALEKTRNLYNVNSISQKLALAALGDPSYLEVTTAAVRRTRDDFSQKLRLLGFECIPSHANFILCSPPKHLGEDGALMLYRKLMDRGIYVRYYQTPRLRDKLRISIGTDEEMDILYAELRSLVTSP